MASPGLARPEASEYSPGVDNYIRQVPEGDLLVILERQLDELALLAGKLTDEQALVQHAPYTWSIKQVIGHMTDCERVFGYRLLGLARNDKTPLPGFDENAYMDHSDFDRGKIADLLEEFRQLRRSHLLLLRALPSEAWLRSGTVNGHPQSTRAAVCVMAGHAQHHLNILKKRLASPT